MSEAVLSRFRELGGALSERPRVKVEITLKSDRMLSALYDPLFRTVTIGGMTVPAAELSVWTKLSWGSGVAKITAKNFEGKESEEN